MTNVENDQYSLVKIILLWALVTLPMGLFRFIVVPWLIPVFDIHPGMIFWWFMILGMMWQFVVSVVVLKIELKTLDWSRVKKRLWINPPVDRKTGDTFNKALWLTIPVILYSAFVSQTGFFSFMNEGLLKIFPHLETPDFANIQNLVDPVFRGAWYVFFTMFVSMIFNYILGEELFFRGILLPKMQGVFGRWDWLANGILFALYHVHKIEFIPTLLLSSLFIAYLNKRYRSFWPAVIIHGIEAIPLVIMVSAVVFGWM